MRADRLISIIVLLQNRIMSAHELADELGVCRRTIYRDIDTLCDIGVPIYAEYGTDGGYQIMEHYRTDLSSLTSDEMNTLLMINFPEPLADLEAGHKLKTTLLKLSAAAGDTPQKIYLDWAWWGQNQTPAPRLQQLYRAVKDNRKIQIGYRFFQGITDIERVVEPYGLVAKAGVWYLVYAGSGRIHHRRVIDINDVLPLDEHFVRPPDFDLEAYWKAARAEIEAEFNQFKVVLRVSPSIISWLPRLLKRTIPTDGTPDADGWTRMELYFDRFETARQELLALGGGVEVLEPEALRQNMRDFAEQILRVYTCAE
jgi:predicted DNA-binding transcriptional regulator YafY